MRKALFALVTLLAFAVAARAEDAGYGHLDFARMTQAQQDFFWRRLKSLAIEDGLLGYCGEKDDFARRASVGIAACVTKAALEKAQSYFDAERRVAEATLRLRKASCKGGGVKRGWLGVEVAQAPKGVLVSAALPDSPAAVAGLKAGDVIESVDGAAVSGPKALVERIRALAPGASVALALTREGAGRTLSVKLGGMTVDASGQAALDMPSLISASRDDLAKVATEVTDMCGRCKSSIWAVFCR